MDVLQSLLESIILFIERLFSAALHFFTAFHPIIQMIAKRLLTEQSILPPAHPPFESRMCS